MSDIIIIVINMMFYRWITVFFNMMLYIMQTSAIMSYKLYKLYILLLYLIVKKLLNKKILIEKNLCSSFENSKKIFSNSFLYRCKSYCSLIWQSFCLAILSAELVEIVQVEHVAAINKIEWHFKIQCVREEKTNWEMVRQLFQETHA